MTYFTSLKACVDFFDSFAFFPRIFALFFSLFLLLFARSALSIFILFNDYFLWYKEIVYVQLNFLVDGSILFNN